MRGSLLVGSFLVGFSATACASHRHAFVPVEYAQDRVIRHAYELERATWNLAERAESYRHDDGRYVDNAFRELRRLERKSRDFRRRVERYHWRDRRSWRGFRELQEQYYRTESAVRSIRAPGLVRSLDRVRVLVSRLRGYYGSHGGPY